jgi:transcriptional regulator with XRE-family HTH domain
MPKKTRGLPRQYHTFRRSLAHKLGTQIRSKRLELGLNQTEVRERLQLEGVFVTRSQFSRIEGGTRLPDAAEIIGLCRVFRVTVDWLFSSDKKESDASKQSRGRPES